MGEYLSAISCCNEFLILNSTNVTIIQLKLNLNDKISSKSYNSIEEEKTPFTTVPLLKC